MEKASITVWCSSLFDSIDMIQNYNKDGWKRKKEPILKWNWSSFKLMYYFKVIK
jgi:hypothetical protein